MRSMNVDLSGPGLWHCRGKVTCFDKPASCYFMLRLASQRLLRLSLTTNHRHVRNFRTTVPTLNAGPTKLHNILEDTNQSFVKIRGATAKGIEFEDGFLLPSSCICIDEQVFLWNVPSKLGKEERWEKKHFSLFEVVVPKPGMSVMASSKLFWLLT